MQKKPPKCCHPACEYCPYDDCVWDGMEFEEYTVETIVEPIPEALRKKRAAANRYVAIHREQHRKRNLEYYYTHREECLERSRRWCRENKARVAAAKRKRWAENPEYYRQKQRDYRARKRKETAEHDP